jgi:hypothetical protein
MGYQEDRRRLPRRRTKLSAVAAFGDGPIVRPCTVRDRSSVGARLMVEEGTILPDSFHLIELMNAEVHRADVIWRDAAFVGVSLHDRGDLTAPVSPTDKAFADLRLRLLARNRTPTKAPFKPNKV